MVSKEELRYLIVGDTPVTQLSAWRLSLASCFIIVVSTSISNDGLISWKSNKLGSNFYKPNISTRDLSTFSKTYGSIAVDVAIIGTNSITQLQTQLNAMRGIIDEKTIIVLDCSFGVELELRVLERFPSNTVIGVLSDAEVRKLSTGSYALISDSICFQFGLTYNLLEGESMKKNRLRYEELRLDASSIFMKFLNILKGSYIGDIKIHEGNKSSFAICVWESIIPRIALNVLSIVFEQISYDELIKHDSNHRIFNQLVKELLNICYKQSMGMVVESFVFEKDIKTPNYENIVNTLKNKQIELEKFTTSEYPEFLALCYEAYCFYHRIEFPCSLLLSQCIMLAEKYECPYDNLVFLESFYLRLLSLSGLKVDEDWNGEVKKPNLLFGREILFSPAEKEATSKPIREGSSVKTKVKLKRATRKRKLVKAENVLNSADIQLPHELQEMYLRVDAVPFSPSTTPHLEVPEVISSTDHCESEMSSMDEELEGFSSETGGQVQLTNYNLSLYPKRNMAPVSQKYLSQEDDNIDDSLKLPFFKGFKNIVQRPITTGTLGISSLEKEIRNSNFDFSTQMYFPASQKLETSQNLPYNVMMNQYWKMVKQQHINNGQLQRPITNQEDMLKFHCETLNKSQVQLSTTTDRYGDLDFSNNLSEHWKHGKGGLYKLLSDK